MPVRPQRWHEMDGSGYNRARVRPVFDAAGPDDDGCVVGSDTTSGRVRGVRDGSFLERGAWSEVRAGMEVSSGARPPPLISGDCGGLSSASDRPDGVRACSVGRRRWPVVPMSGSVMLLPLAPRFEDRGGGPWDDLGAWLRSVADLAATRLTSDASLLFSVPRVGEVALGVCIDLLRLRSVRPVGVPSVCAVAAEFRASLAWIEAL